MMYDLPPILIRSLNTIGTIKPSHSKTDLLLRELLHIMYDRRLLASRKIKKFWTSIGLVSIFLVLSQQLICQTVLTIVDCKTDKPISDLYILNGSDNSFLGYTRKEETVQLKGNKIPEKLRFKKLGALDTTVVLSPGQTKLCLHRRTNELGSVEINGKFIPLHEQFKQFIEKTVEVLPMEDDSLYYSFQYAIEVPDSGWTSTISGVALIPMNSYKKRLAGGYTGKICSLKIEADSDFYEQELFSKINTNYIPRIYLGYDFLRKSFRYRVKIKDGMVSEKQIRVDTTLFYVNGFGIKKNYTYASIARFNQDSILTNVKWTAHTYEKSYKSSDQVPIGISEVKMDYNLERSPYFFNCLTVNSQFYPISETNYNIQVETHLLDNQNCECANIHIMTKFNRESIAEHPEIDVELTRRESK